MKNNLLSEKPYPDQTFQSLLMKQRKMCLIIESAGVYGNVIRFLAPLVITDGQLATGLDILKKTIAKGV